MVRGLGRLRVPHRQLGETNIYGTEEVAGGFIGHQNTKYPVPRLPREQALEPIYDWIAAQGAVAQWNHPNYYVGDRWGDFLDYAYWTPERDAGMCMLEIFNKEIQEASYVPGSRRRLARAAVLQLRHPRGQLDHG